MTHDSTTPIESAIQDDMGNEYEGTDDGGLALLLINVEDDYTFSNARYKDYLPSLSGKIFD